MFCKLFNFLAKFYFWLGRWEMLSVLLLLNYVVVFVMIVLFDKSPMNVFASKWFIYWTAMQIPALVSTFWIYSQWQDENHL
jgi:hypothetical protein